MKFDRKNLLLYAVTDRKWSGTKNLFEQTEEALKNGVTCVQLREKAMGHEDFVNEALKMAALCRKYHVPFIVNDSVETAIAAGADGVHVGQDDMSIKEVRALAGENMVIGASAHNVEEALKAEAEGADYLGCGSVFVTETKKNVTSLSKDELRRICSAVSIPVVAIGGINESNASALSGSGVDGIAVVSAIYASQDPGAAAARLAEISRCIITSAYEGK